MTGKYVCHSSDVACIVSGTTISLWWKMASDLEEPSYSSPPKRLKLDNSIVLCSKSSETDSVSYSASFKVPEITQNSKYNEILAKISLLFCCSRWRTTCKSITSLIHRGSCRGGVTCYLRMYFRQVYQLFNSGLISQYCNVITLIVDLCLLTK